MDRVLPVYGGEMMLTKVRRELGAEMRQPVIFRWVLIWVKKTKWRILPQEMG